MIRCYQETDLQPLVSLFTRCVHKSCGSFYTPDQLETWAPGQPDMEKWGKRFSTGETRVFEEKDTVAGFIRIGPAAHIDLLYVHSDFQRQGIAAALLDKVIDQSICRGKNLTTFSSLAAQAFFSAQGFTVIRENEVERSGQRLRNLLMQRSSEFSE